MPDPSQGALDVARGIALCGGNEALYRRLLGTLETESRDSMRAMDGLSAAGRLDELSRVAHRLKGQAAALAAEPVRRAAAELERAAREGAPDASERVEAVRSAVEALWRRLEEESRG